MAKFLTNLNLLQNELQNARIQNLATAPANPVKGQIYFHSNENKLYVFDGTVWIALDNTTIVNRSTAPANPAPGEVYYDVEDGRAYIWDAISELWVGMDAKDAIASLTSDGVIGIINGTGTAIIDETKIDVDIARKTDIKDGTLALSISGTAGDSNTTITVGTGTGFSANTASNAEYTLKVGPALTEVASVLNGTATGFVKKTAANTLTLDNSTYAGSSSAGGAANSVANSLTLSFDGGTTTNVDTYAFNGSTSQFIDIVAGANIDLSAEASEITINAQDTLYSLSTLTGPDGNSKTIRLEDSEEGTSDIVLAVAAVDTINGLSISETGNTITLAHADTSAQADVTNTNGSVIQSLDLDTYGHLVGITSINLDDRYYTETEADNRFVNSAGDTMTGFLILHADPTQAKHAATKEYVDSVAEGLHVKQGVDLATTDTLIAMAGGDAPVITYTNGDDGVGATLVLSGDYDYDFSDDEFWEEDTPSYEVSLGIRVLIKNEANAAHNGIYVITDATTLTRATDYDSDIDVDPGDFVFVSDGPNAKTGWVQVNTVNVIGTDDIIWDQFSGAGTYKPGVNLELIGETFNVLTIKPNLGGTGLTSVTTVGELYYGNDTTAMGRIAPVASGSVLVSTGIDTAPAYSATPSVTSLAASTSVITPSVFGTATASGTLNLVSTSDSTKGTVNVGSDNAGTLNIAGSTVNIKVGDVTSAGFLKVAATTGTVSIDTTTNYARKVAGTLTMGTPAAGAYTFDHNLNTKDVTVSIYDSGSNLVIADVELTSVNQASITFGSGVTTGQTYRVVVVG